MLSSELIKTKKKYKIIMKNIVSYLHESTENISLSSCFLHSIFIIQHNYTKRCLSDEHMKMEYTYKKEDIMQCQCSSVRARNFGKYCKL